MVDRHYHLCPRCATFQHCDFQCDAAEHHGTSDTFRGRPVFGPAMCDDCIELNRSATENHDSTESSE